jgi:hypothetical protein
MPLLTLSNKDNVAFKEPSGLPNGKQYLGKSTDYSHNQKLDFYNYYSIKIKHILTPKLTVLCFSGNWYQNERAIKGD